MFSRPQFVLSILLVAAIALEAAHIAYLQFVTFHPLPWNDEWGTMALFSAMEENGGDWSFLLFPHGGHRLVLPRLVTMLDVKLADGTGAFTLFAIDCLLFALAALWGLIVTGKWDNSRPTDIAAPYVLALCIACHLLSGHQMSNLVWAFQIAVFMIYVFAFLAFAALGSALQSAARGRIGRSGALVLLACGLGACAALSLANGIIVLPALLVIALGHRKVFPIGLVFLIGIAFVVVLGIYFQGLDALASVDADASSTTAVTLLDFFLNFLGGPWASIAPTSVTFAGLVTLLIAVYVLVKYWRAGTLRSDDVVAVGLILLVLGSAAMAALGRIHLGIEAATESRYSTPVLVLYAALLVSLWPRIRADANAADPGASARVKRHELAMAVVVACALIYAVRSHWQLPYDYRRLPLLKSDAEAGYVADVQDPEHFKFVASSVDLAWSARRYLLRHNLSVFSTTMGRSVDRRLTDVFTVSERQCLGHLDQVESVVPGPNGGFRIYGWAWHGDNRAVPPGVVFVESGVVKGIARFIVERPDVATARREVGLRSGFAGYVPRGVTKVTAYALTQNETAVCRIPGELSLPAS